VTKESVVLDGRSLTIEAVEAVARRGVRAALHPDLLDAPHKATREPPPGSEEIESTTLGPDDHVASAPGMALAFDQVRAAMLVQANHLAGEETGMRLEFSMALLRMLEHNLTPHIASLGSSDARGAMPPRRRTAARLPDLTQVTWTPARAKAWLDGELLDGECAMRRAGLDPSALPPEENAFPSKTAFCTAMLTLALVDAQRLFDASMIAAAMSLEALLAVSAAFDERLHLARLHPGQTHVARRVRELMRGSSLIDSGDHVQDAYSLRCVPQVLGPILEWMQFAALVAERELNPAAERTPRLHNTTPSFAIHTCAPIALAADSLKAAFTTCGAIAERRIFRLISDHTNRGLPAMLVADPEAAGLQSGLMMLQYTAASLVHENQSLAAPSYTPSKTDAGEGKVSSEAAVAVHHLNTILDNLTHIVALEMITAAQALDLRLRDHPHWELGSGVGRAHQHIRASVPYLDRDRPLSDDVQEVVELLASGRMHAAVMEGLDEARPPD
jgi:histidine ammonia-lyase